MSDSILHYLQVRYGAPIIAGADSLRRSIKGTTAILVAGVYAGTAYAEDPTAVGGDVATTLKALISEYIIIGLLAIAAIAFVVVAWSVITKFNDARRGRADWGEVVVPFVVGAGLLVFIGYLVTEGQTAATAITG